LINPPKTWWCRIGALRWIAVGWVLAEALVRAVIIEMMHVVMEDGEGVSFVVDQ
jgi:hypothetical protein